MSHMESTKVMRLHFEYTQNALSGCSNYEVGSLAEFLASLSRSHVRKRALDPSKLRLGRDTFLPVLMENVNYYLATEEKGET